MSDDFATKVLKTERDNLLEYRADLEADLERLRKDVATLEANVTRCNDQLRQLDEAIQARAALTPSPEAEPGSGHAEIEIPEGFTKWNGSSGCRFVGDTIVHCWMGGDDYMGPLRAGDVDWDHHSDPVLAVKVIRYANGMTPEMYGSEFPEASAHPDADGALDEFSTSPGEVEESRDQSAEPDGYQHVVDAAPVNYEPAPIIADPSSVEELGEQSEPHSAAHEAEEQPQDLPPLLPPEAPKAITPEDMEARGLVDSEASWWARKMAKELA